MEDKLRDLIARGKTDQVLKILLKETKKLTDKQLSDEIRIQSGKFEQYTRDSRIGILNREEQQVTQSQINNALLEIINKMEGNQSVNHSISTNTPTIKDKPAKPWQRVAFILGILASIAGITGYTFRDYFSASKVKSFTVTVLVHGKEGTDDRILSNQGKVMLDIGGDRKEEPINNQGQAIFQELPSGYIGEQVRISIIHPQPYFPVNRDTQYLLKQNQSIYLEIELKGIDKIMGRVLDELTEKPVDSVRVSYRNNAAYTDEFGWFELEIPEAIRAKFIRVNFFKAGYKMQDIDSIAPHTQQEIGILLKPQ